MSVYYNFLDSFFKGEHDLVDDTFKLMLLDSTYSVDLASHTTVSDISAYEVSGSGYAAGGATLFNKAWAKSGSSYILTANDVGWFEPTISPRYAALYNDTHASDELIAYFDLGSTLSPSGTTLVLSWGATIISMSILANVYANLIYLCGLGEIDLSSDTLKGILMGTGYSPDNTAHETYSDISSDEITGTGYTAGGVELVYPTVSLSGSTVKFDLGTGPAWADLDLDADCRYIVLYDDTHSDDPLIYYEDLGADTDPAGDSFVVNVNSGGVFTYA